MSAKAGMTFVEMLLALAVLSVCELLTIPLIREPDLSPGQFIAEVLPYQARAIRENRELNAQISADPLVPVRIHYNAKGRIDQARTLCFSRRCLVMELAGGRIVGK